jgi:hypothetical protein
MSNVFVVRNKTIATPALDRCGVAGTMRQFVLDLREKQGNDVQVCDLEWDELVAADEVRRDEAVGRQWYCRVSSMNRIAIILFVAAALVAGLATAGIWQMNRFMISEVNLPADGAVFEVPPGSSLVDNGIIESDFWFRLYARWSGEAGRIHAGEYIIEQGATPKSLLEQFTSGAVRLYSFTIIEGWNHREAHRSRTRKACSCPKPTGFLATHRIASFSRRPISR